MNSLMWTATTRAHHKRDGLRFASDVTADAAWTLIEPLLPACSPVGGPPKWPKQEIVNAIFYAAPSIGGLGALAVHHCGRWTSPRGLHARGPA
jgi:hypothetical protein